MTMRQSTRNNPLRLLRRPLFAIRGTIRLGIRISIRTGAGAFLFDRELFPLPSLPLGRLFFIGQRFCHIWKALHSRFRAHSTQNRIKRGELLVCFNGCILFCNPKTWSHMIIDKLLNAGR